ncbi:nucleoside diphosphate kinase 6 [Callorhinchus milii]|uniref:Nucleoside diphosphate kinase 6 n=1 Tax=Callorhinchus milii TaxID=7868 RepID=K4FSG4_CALMI|nr:nucleoside diphosphate kinase 6 [Callorhinchus milii]AFK10973.1 Nucleoside diphosphate kinase 6 [Callorhinchus milii]|eukprot:gi/632991196/ref/XP_007884518.1/ PREDICTED: nucleoside diphosphate kinase 6 [Callorhinchus milii]
MEATVRLSRPVLQLTLALVKPDAVAHPLILQAIHQKILENDFIIVTNRDLTWSREASQTFYSQHSGRFFYQRLVEFMSSGPLRAYILAHEDAIRHWRKIMGPTQVCRARYTAPHTIRGSYGLTDTRNSTHGSDCPESASRELATFFPEFSEGAWAASGHSRGDFLYHTERQVHLVRSREAE